MALLAAHPYIATILGLVVTIGIPSVINEFRDPDHNPDTPPPAWVRWLIILNDLLAARTADGKWMLPLTLPKSQPPAGPTLALLLVASLFAQGCTLSQATANSYRTLTAAETVVLAAQNQFPTIARNKRLAIVAAAKTAGEGRTALDAWQVIEDRLAKSIEGTDATIKLCRDAIAEIRKGLRDKSQLAGWIATGLRLGLDLKDLLAAAGVPLGGL